MKDYDIDAILEVNQKIKCHRNKIKNTKMNPQYIVKQIKDAKESYEAILRSRKLEIYKPKHIDEIKTKFTKGNWKVGKYLNLVECDNDILATCHHFMPKCRTKEEAFANAELISAAPDMFNVLVDLYNDKEIWSELFESQQEFICQALNKATGSTFFQNL